MSLSNLFTNCAWNPRAFMSNKYLSFLLPWVLIVLILGQLTRKKKIKKKIIEVNKLLRLEIWSHFVAFLIFLFLFFFFSFFPFFLSEMKKYVLIEVKIQEKDEKSFPQNTKTDQKRIHPSIENYIQR